MKRLQGLKHIFLFGVLLLVMRVVFADEIPPLPLNEPLPPGHDSSWIDTFGEDLAHPEIGASFVRIGESEIEIRNPHRFVDGVTEFVLTDEEGKFTASWCSGRLAFASLVLPQIDESGARKEWRTIPMLDLAGELLSTPECEMVKRALAGTWFLPQGQTEPVAHDELTRFPATEIVALLLVETDRKWDHGFTCFDAGNRFGSHSSHASPCNGGVMGSAEMFTWHSAAMRLAWDLRPEGDHESEPVPLNAGATFQRGGNRIEIAGIEEGEFRRSNGGGKIRPGEPAKFARVAGGAVPRTAFLAGTIPGRSIRGIEGRKEGAPWEELPFTPEDDGVVAIDLPEGGALTELRVIWAPGRLRVVVDVPGIGGGLSENEGITNYNEVSFRFHQDKIENSGISWRFWQLTGRYPKIESERFASLRARKADVDPSKLHRAGDLLAIWRELNPECHISWDEKLGTLVVKDK